MTLRTSTLALVSTFSLAAACGSTATQNTRTTAADDHQTGSMHDARARTATAGGDNASPSCAVAPVYFAFDSSELDGSARNTLDGDATCLRDRNASARVTGMTDPQGTEEYNLALGDRRARAVSQYMTNLGVDEVNVRSVGEEQARGEDESGWVQDRRADIDTH